MPTYRLSKPFYLWVHFISSIIFISHQQHMSIGGNGVLANATILVTGGTGSLGYALIEQLLLHRPARIIVYSRNETSQFIMSRKFEDASLAFWIGDVRDQDSLHQACQGVDYIFHLAALTHVSFCEEHPQEALKTNVVGTQYVIEAAIANQVQAVIFASTDQAVEPTSCYGMTKAMGENLIMNANIVSESTRFIAVRSSNVLGTHGSVPHVLLDQIKNKKLVSMMDRGKTCFITPMKQAVDLLLKALQSGIGGELYTMKMPSCALVHMAEVFIEMCDEGDVRLIFTGSASSGKGKIHDILISESESRHTVKVGDSYFIVLPQLGLPRLHEHYAAYPSMVVGEYTSAEGAMMKEEIRELLFDSGLLYEVHVSKQAQGSRD